VQSVVAEAEVSVQQDEERRRRKTLAQKRQLAATKRSTSPEPVPGRTHAGLQTETFLEVLSDRVPEEEVGTQTDATKDRPPTPLFVPRPSGVDAATQIEPSDLFDFDAEVVPVLEVLVGKSLDLALVEVLQEDELAAMRAQQEAFSALRSAELAEVQRLEGEVKRRQDERARRLKQERDRVVHQAEVQRKVAASSFARTYLVSMRYSVLAQLADQGHFYDPLRREIESRFMPRLLSAAGTRAAARGANEGAAALVDALIVSALKSGGERYAGHIAQIAAAAAAVEAARKAAEDEASAQLAAQEAAEAAAAAAALAESEEGAPEGDDSGANQQEGTT
jgi:radial spoke head protein 3